MKEKIMGFFKSKKVQKRAGIGAAIIAGLFILIKVFGAKPVSDAELPAWEEVPEDFEVNEVTPD
jgi:hypothetical protein